MADLDWRVWLYERLTQSSLFTELVPVDSVYGAGSLVGPPADKPFVVIKLGEETEGVPGTSIVDCTLWFHDEPGNYNRLGEMAKLAKDVLCGAGWRTGQVPDPGGIAVRWQSTGPDLSDDGYGTLVKTSEYQLVGRNGHA